MFQWMANVGPAYDATSDFRPAVLFKRVGYWPAGQVEVSALVGDGRGNAGGIRHGFDFLDCLGRLHPTCVSSYLAG